MAWCYYCRRYTVNGQCPACGRIYQDPHKSYDFYGKEIKKQSSATTRKTSSSEPTYYSDPKWGRGFWLGIAINFGAIIIAKKTGRVRVSGAIVGMVINSILTLHILGIYLSIMAQSSFDFWGLFS